MQFEALLAEAINPRLCLGLIASVISTPSSIISTSTLSYTLTDEAGNTAILTFEKFKNKENDKEQRGETETKLSTILYTTVSTTTQSIFLENEVEYGWEKTKMECLKN